VQPALWIGLAVMAVLTFKVEWLSLIGRCGFWLCYGGAGGEGVMERDGLGWVWGVMEVVGLFGGWAGGVGRERL